MNVSMQGAFNLGGKLTSVLHGVDRGQGCVVIARPDQYVAHVPPLDAHAELSAFFAGFLRRV